MATDRVFRATPELVRAHIATAVEALLEKGPTPGRKTLDAFVICPVAPHTLTVRPVVDAADRVYEVVVPQPKEGTMVVVDGLEDANMKSVVLRSPDGHEFELSTCHE